MWSYDDGRRTSRSLAVSWAHGPLSVEAVKQERRATNRTVRRETSGASAAVRRAAVELAESGRESMTTGELMTAARHHGAGYTLTTLRDALRLRPGLLALRDAGVIVPAEVRGTTVSAHVLRALRELGAAGRTDVRHVEVEAHLAASGMRYSSRAVRDGLTRLLRNPSAPVTRTGHRYRLTAGT